LKAVTGAQPSISPSRLFAQSLASQIAHVLLTALRAALCFVAVADFAKRRGLFGQRDAIQHPEAQKHKHDDYSRLSIHAIHQHLVFRPDDRDDALAASSIKILTAMGFSFPEHSAYIGDLSRRCYCPRPSLKTSGAAVEGMQTARRRPQ